MLNDGVGLSREELIVPNLIGIEPNSPIEDDKPEYFAESVAHGVAMIGFRGASHDYDARDGVCCVAAEPNTVKASDHQDLFIPVPFGFVSQQRWR